MSRWKPCRAAEYPHGAGRAALLIGMFGVLGLATRLLCADANGYSSFWTANGAMLVALLTLRARYSIVVLVACLFVNMALNRLSGLSTGEGMLACLMNVLLVLLVAGPTRRFCGARTDLTTLRRQSIFCLIVLMASGIEAAIGVPIEFYLLGDHNNMYDDWVQWVLCDALGLVLATPALMLLMRPRRPHAGEPSRVVEPLLLMLGIVLLTAISFSSSRSFLFLFLYPAMLILAFRTPPVWALGTVLLASICASAFTAHDMGPIALMSPDGSAMRQNMLQPYLWSLFLSALPANSVVGERRRYMQRLALLRAHLAHAATHDQLTGLLTRQLFKSKLNARIRSAEGGSVLFIDLDYFKQINDTLGHRTGDAVLRAFSQRLNACACLAGGVAARFGGDEFVLYAPASADGTLNRSVVEMVLEAARRAFVVENSVLTLSASVGAALLHGEALDADAIIQRADQALYAAKMAGRNGYRLFDELESSQEAEETAGQVISFRPAAGRA